MKLYAFIATYYDSDNFFVMASSKEEAIKSIDRYICGYDLEIWKKYKNEEKGISDDGEEYEYFNLIILNENEVITTENN